MGVSGEKAVRRGEKTPSRERCGSWRFAGDWGPTEFQELRSFVMLKLVENDFGRLRKHQSHGSLAAYLSVVVHRLYLDDQIGRWGQVAIRRRKLSVAVTLRLSSSGSPIATATRSGKRSSTS